MIKGCKGKLIHVDLEERPRRGQFNKAIRTIDKDGVVKKRDNRGKIFARWEGGG
jgi:hypothetical protein